VQKRDQAQHTAEQVVGYEHFQHAHVGMPREHAGLPLPSERVKQQEQKQQHYARVGVVLGLPVGQDGRGEIDVFRTAHEQSNSDPHHQRHEVVAVGVVFVLEQLPHEHNGGELEALEESLGWEAASEARSEE